MSCCFILDSKSCERDWCINLKLCDGFDFGSWTTLLRESVLLLWIVSEYWSVLRAKNCAGAKQKPRSAAWPTRALASSKPRSGGGYWIVDVYIMIVSRNILGKTSCGKVFLAVKMNCFKHLLACAVLYKNSTSYRCTLGRQYKRGLLRAIIEYK